MNEASFESEWRRFSQKRLSVKWQAARVNKESGGRRTERARGTVHSTFRRNDDASNMSPTDIPAGIPVSANYRPEAHVFPFLYCIELASIPFHRPALFPFHLLFSASRFKETLISPLRALFARASRFLFSKVNTVLERVPFVV